MGVISGVISRIAIEISYISGLRTPLITTREPPSTLKAHGFRFSLVSDFMPGRPDTQTTERNPYP